VLGLADDPTLTRPTLSRLIGEVPEDPRGLARLLELLAGLGQLSA
jgi:hypothetical protein